VRHVALGLIALVAACSINHRSDEVACVFDNDCGGNGKVCRDNQCVGGTDTDGGPKKDAPPPKPDAFVCPFPCTSCEMSTNTCIVDCSVNPNACEGQVVCPAGFNCDIRCSTDNSCRNGVNCTMGIDCTIECTGVSSCRGLVCGTGACKVGCNALDACRNVQCGNACACDTECSNGARCENIFCKQGPNGLCKFTFGGCTSQLDGCNTCP